MDSSDKFFDKFNIMIIGDERVGKTSILLRHFNKTYFEDRKTTIGVEYFEKTVHDKGKKFLVKLWDTAGQEKFASLAKSYYQRAHGIILACAVDDLNSFKNLKKWIRSIKDNTTDKNIKLIILANKVDLRNERVVSEIDIRNKAKELGINYFETSAKENINIDEAFDYIIKEVVNNVYSEDYKESLMKKSGSKILSANPSMNNNNNERGDSSDTSGFRTKKKKCC